MADGSIYSTLELPAPPPVQEDSRWKPRAVLHPPRLSCLVMVALGLLTVILLSLLMYQRILCCGSKDSTCCPNLWIRNGSYCYYFSVEKKDWNSSLKFCADNGSHLLTFLDNQEMVYKTKTTCTDWWNPLSQVTLWFSRQDLLYYDRTTALYVQANHFTIELHGSSPRSERCSSKAGEKPGNPHFSFNNPLLEYLGQDFYYWIGLRNIDGWRWEGGPALSLRILSNSLIQKCGAIHRNVLQASSCEVALRWICKKVLY